MVFRITKNTNSILDVSKYWVKIPQRLLYRWMIGVTVFSVKVEFKKIIKVLFVSDPSPICNNFPYVYYSSDNIDAVNCNEFPC